MQINTLVRYNFTADYLVPRINTDNEVTVYVVDTLAMPVAIVSGRQQTIMFTKVGVEYGSKVQNVKNPRGILLFTVPSDTGIQQYDMYVHANDPVIDVYGNIVGYRQVLRAAQPVLTDLKELVVEEL